jgi:hypothetical protein
MPRSHRPQRRANGSLQQRHRPGVRPHRPGHDVSTSVPVIILGANVSTAFRRAACFLTMTTHVLPLYSELRSDPQPVRRTGTEAALAQIRRQGRTPLPAESDCRSIRSGLRPTRHWQSVPPCRTPAGTSIRHLTRRAPSWTAPREATSASHQPHTGRCWEGDPGISDGSDLNNLTHGTPTP